MLEALKAARRNGDATGKAVPLALHVWESVHQIAQRPKVTASEVVEQLVVRKVAELWLLPRK